MSFLLFGRKANLSAGDSSGQGRRGAVRIFAGLERDEAGSIAWGDGHASGSAASSVAAMEE
jgi:ABC-type transport system involved in cytochrome c biogenesis ATPase subunit